MKASQLKAGVVLAYLAQGIHVLAQLFYTPVVLRLLGEQEYGLYSLVTSSVGYLSLLSFGIGGAYLRFYFRAKKEEGETGVARLNAMFLLLYLIIAAVALAIGSLFAGNPAILFGDKLTTAELDTSRLLLLLLTLDMAVTLPNTVFTSYIMAHERYVLLRGCSIAISVLTPLISLPLLLFGTGTLGLACATVAVHFAVSVCYILYSVKKLSMRFCFSGMRWGALKEIYVFSFFLFLNQIIDQINWHVDALLLGRFWGTAEVAVYSLAGKINSLYIAVSTAVSSVLAPRVHEIVGSGENVDARLNRLMLRTGRIQYLLLAPLWMGAVLLGKTFLVWMGGSASFSRSYYVLLLLITSVTVPLVQNVGLEIQRAKNKHRFRSLMCIAMALLNLCISIPLSGEYGAVGAAVGTAVSLSIGNGFLMNWYYHKHLGMDMRFFWRGFGSLARGSVLPMVYCFLLVACVDVSGIFSFLAAGIGLVAVYGLSMWAIGMNSEEKDQLRQPLQRLCARRKMDEHR